MKLIRKILAKLHLWFLIAIRSKRVVRRPKHVRVSKMRCNRREFYVPDDNGVVVPMASLVYSGHKYYPGRNREGLPLFLPRPGYQQKEAEK